MFRKTKMEEAAIRIQIWWRNLLKLMYEEPICSLCNKEPQESFGYCSDCFKFERKQIRI